MKILPAMTDRRGGLIIEVLLAVAMALVFGSTLVSLARANRAATSASGLQTQAVALARESLEQVYAMKAESWSNVAGMTGTFHVVRTAAGYELQPSPELIDSTFERSVDIVKGQRQSGRLVAAGGTVDENVRLVTVIVEWTDRDQPKSVSLSGYVTNWKEAAP